MKNYEIIEKYGEIKVIENKKDIVLNGERYKTFVEISKIDLISINQNNNLEFVIKNKPYKINTLLIKFHLFNV